MALSAHLSCGPTAPKPKEVRTLEPNQAAPTVDLPDGLAVMINTPEGRIVDSQAINVVFNQPVVALTDLEAQKARTMLLIEPALPGDYHWLGSSTLSFIPQSGFDLATEYTVTIPEGLTAVSGQVLDDDFSWSFETPRPELVDYRPSDYSGVVGLNEPITMTFNQPVELEEVRAKTTVCRDEEGESIPFAIRRPDGAVEQEQYHVRLGERAVILEPQRSYPKDSEIYVSVDEGLRGKIGPLTSDNAFGFS